MFENMKSKLFSTKKKDLGPINTSEELGGAGTKKLGGFLHEEYNSELQGLNGVEKYEEMRSSDASVSALLLAAELPIRSTKWFIAPGKTNGKITPQDEEIAAFINDTLFNNIIEGSFDEFLRQSLTMLPFGHSVFEKVYAVKGDKIIIRKLAQRMQHSIYAWETEDGGTGITQKFLHDSKGNDTVSIPDEYLLTFSFRKEGDNYEGRSILRAAYKHWYIKDNLYKIDAVKHERLGIGIPVIYLPKGATTDDKEEAETILENLRGTEQTYVVLPSDQWKLEFMDLKGGAASDPSKSISHHDRQISKSILAQFMELGAESSSGSYALSEDQSSLFTLGLAAIAKQFAEVVNKGLIEELTLYNFDLKEGQTMPKLTFSKLGDVDYEKLTQSINNLVEGGVLGVDDSLEDHLREVMDLPERTEESIRKPLESVVKSEKVDKTVKKPTKKANSKEKYSEEVLTFSEHTKVEARVAKKIIAYIEKKAEMDPVGISDIGIVLANLKHYLRMKQSMTALLNKATDKEIEDTVDELIEWREKYDTIDLNLPKMGFGDAEEAKDFGEIKKILNFLEVKNVQNGK